MSRDRCSRPAYGRSPGSAIPTEDGNLYLIDKQVPVLGLVIVVERQGFCRRVPGLPRHRSTDQRRAGQLQRDLAGSVGVAVQDEESALAHGVHRGDLGSGVTQDTSAHGDAKRQYLRTGGRQVDRPDCGMLTRSSVSGSRYCRRT